LQHALEPDSHTGISGFGMNGTNVHLVVSGYEATQISETLSQPKYPVLAFSAHSPDGLKKQVAASEAAWPFSNASELSIGIAVSNYARSHYAYRAAFSGSNAEQMRSEISGWLEQANVVQVADGKTLFLMPGQDSHFLGMGKSLYLSEPVFKTCVDNAAIIFEKELGILPTELMWGDKQELLNQTEYQQPALVLYQYSLAQVLIEQGINPDVLLGHSLGEFVAAAIAGIFTLEEALTLVSLPFWTNVTCLVCE